MAARVSLPNLTVNYSHSFSEQARVISRVLIIAILVSAAGLAAYLRAENHLLLQKLSCLVLHLPQTWKDT